MKQVISRLCFWLQTTPVFSGSQHYVCDVQYVSNTGAARFFDFLFLWTEFKNLQIKHCSACQILDKGMVQIKQIVL